MVSGWILYVIVVKEACLHLINLMFDFHVCRHFLSLMALIISRTSSAPRDVLLQVLELDSNESDNYECMMITDNVYVYFCVCQ